MQITYLDGKVGSFENKEVIIAILQDITERKKVEDILKEFLL